MDNFLNNNGKFNKIYTDIYAIVTKRGIPYADREDVVHNCIKNLLLYKKIDLEKAYIYRVVGNECKRYYKKRKRQKEIFDKVVENSEENCQIDDFESITTLNLLIDELPEKDQREFVRSYILNNRKIKDVAAEYKISINAAQKRLAKILSYLRKKNEVNS